MALTSRTSKLSAVNTMLFAIGESPVNTLSGGIGVDTATAIKTLDDISREVQSDGWNYNTEKHFPLSRQAFSPYVFYVPDTALECDPSDPTLPIIVRGNRLYDSANHTFEFTEMTLDVDITWHFEFDEIPEVARRYIAIRAARTFQDGAVGSDAAHNYSERDEFTARARMKRSCARNRDKNLLRASASVSRILQR